MSLKNLKVVESTPWLNLSLIVSQFNFSNLFCDVHVSSFSKPEYLIRCDWNKILSIKKCFMYMNKDKNVREDFVKPYFEVQSEC